MSQQELRRVEVLARVRSAQLRVIDASRLLQVSYRQTKRLWKRYREEGPAGLKHRSAGRASNRGYGQEFRRRVLHLVREKYGGAVGERFGPTLAAEHLASEDRLRVHSETGAGCWPRDFGAASGSGGSTGEGVSARNISGSWCSWTAAFTPGWRSAEGCLIDLADDATNTTLAQLGEDDLRGGRCAARLDRALRSAFGAVRGLEEPVQAAGQGG